ncbi:hypothetical protein A2291_00045 [candidate division WOR-1 bacterium RIFOXYB2_FULL_42_35]|uniref:NADP-dependent oxidoreductase domain-containing protein n=1 Tax=candidate division WOR-1 bacterium RIFOXYC2_FULL_41_25 TaxID=1802586 RepID=A0A1F4TMK2_UNCSA|nr:MAG: hypothetical protein A2291_00045 [candidate division WOR-1 bacterium RIFOXYB2_FULL_42_35]OGC33799.1 MAG: hypothetical protein A2462_01720 [candidate division WOR-1 bacterium RIFOXYC2_FULL_41_25]OGC43695.1 MAG: hypothetical protein A2548_05270 [candidate division WOR-1 bacterium RIFOXYD2_FULL_41_8]
MRYRTLGKTGLKVSLLSFGTVALGVDYGIEIPAGYGRPTEDQALGLLHSAVDQGVNFFDTAPAYGESERLLGKALKKQPNCYVATKVTIPKDSNGEQLRGRQLSQAIEDSLASSLKLLQRDVLDVVQIHNASLGTVRQGEIAAILHKAKQEGKIRSFGASVYTVEEALAVINNGNYDLLQIAYNILDQRMRAEVFPAAQKAGMGIISRSAFLKGVLTPKAEWLPKELDKLKVAATNIKEQLKQSWQDLPQVALRFCFSIPKISSVLVGVQSEKELEKALKAESLGMLDKETMEKLLGFSFAEEKLLNPANWSIA